MGSCFFYTLYIIYACPGILPHSVIMAVGDSYTYLSEEFESIFILYNSDGNINISGVTSYFGIILYRNLFYSSQNYLLLIFVANSFLFYLASNSFFYSLKKKHIKPYLGYLLIGCNPYVWTILICLNKEILALSLLSLWYFNEEQNGPFLYTVLSAVALFLVRDVYVFIIFIFYVLVYVKSRFGVVIILFILSIIIKFIYPASIVNSEDSGQSMGLYFEFLNILTMSGYHVFSFLIKTIVSTLAVNSLIYKGIYYEELFNIYGLTLSIISVIYIYYLYYLIYAVYKNIYSKADLFLIAYMFVVSVSPIYNFRMYTPVYMVMLFSMFYPNSISMKKSNNSTFKL